MSNLFTELYSEAKIDFIKFVLLPVHPDPLPLAPALFIGLCFIHTDRPLGMYRTQPMSKWTGT
jgi:hypothetical protein